MSEPLLISRREAARMLSISVRTLDYMIAAKEIPARRIHRRTLISVAALQQFARRGQSLNRAGQPDTSAEKIK